VQPGTDKLRNKAERALATAEAALEAGETDAAAGRAFYAMLNAAKARLNEHGLRFHTHARIAAAYAALPRLDSAPASALADAIALRRQPDGDTLTYADVARLVERARTFVIGTHGGE
jgi:uncharacterized protein (UPF0332 family)